MRRRIKRRRRIKISMRRIKRRRSRKKDGEEVGEKD